ncbi:NAD(P)H-quinone oxidoreductase [Kaistia terrae]|uniref:NAD(P)H-quinone oxidoreductase n=1 Tax=Kaistia terrae TaxID=537017 RepID=A0ABW0PNS9_9HYPH|nr:NAD(P)H-quinone oxidoreductase [Kaistia terrae]MCX5580139.1 NAD(P)H-quinone oxidoreductase [Kaistia terrae]
MTSIPQSMTAMAISEPGGPDVLQATQRPVPHPFEHEILIRVAAAGVNRPDVAQRQGHYPPPKGASDLPGLEVAGHVAALGRNCTRFAVGDAVTALVAGGGYAEYVTVNETNALPVPQGFSMIEAAALPETFFTVWHNVFERCGLKSGDVFLVHGGTSGIGTTAIQLAKAFGATVLATAGSPEKCAACVDLGATRAINYHLEDFVDVVKEATDGHGADVILDMVGGDYIERNFSAAAFDGHIAQIAFLNGPIADVNFTRLLVKRLTLTGSTLRPRSVAFKAGIAAALREKVWPLLEKRQILPRIDATYPLAQAAEAHRRMEASSHIGKIVLTL